MLLAAHFCAWFLSYATPARAEASLANMSLRVERTRIGALSCALGMCIVVAALVVDIAGFADGAIYVNLLAYPPLIFGALCLASSTWAPSRNETEAGVSA